MSLLHTKATGNTAFIVNADSYVYYGLVVPQSASNVSVQGHFTATGNSDDDIVVYLLTEKSFCELAERVFNPNVVLQREGHSW